MLPYGNVYGYFPLAVMGVRTQAMSCFFLAIAQTSMDLSLRNRLRVCRQKNFESLKYNTYSKLFKQNKLLTEMHSDAFLYRIFIATSKKAVRRHWILAEPQRSWKKYRYHELNFTN